MLRLFLLLQILIFGFSLSSKDLTVFPCEKCDFKAMSELDPHERSKPYLKEIKELIYEKLYGFDNEGYVVNSLIKKCKIKENSLNKLNVFLSLECEIKKNVVFHDGKNLTTRDVVFSINRLKKSKTLSLDFNFIQSVKAKSPYKLIFKLKDRKKSEKPKRYLFQKFKKTLAMYSYIPSSMYFTNDINWALEYPVGSGRYKFSEWMVWEKDSLSTKIVLKKVAEKEFFPSITFKFFNKDNLKDVLNKEKSAVVLRFNQAFLNKYKKDKKFKFYRKKISSYDYLIFNSKSKNYSINLLNTLNKIIDNIEKDFDFSYVNSKEEKKRILGDYYSDISLEKLKFKKYKKSKDINVLVNKDLVNLDVLDEIKKEALKYSINLVIVKKSFKEYFEIINSLNIKNYDLIFYKMNEDHKFLTTLTEKMFDNKVIQIFQNDFVYLNKNKKIDDKLKVSFYGFLLIDD